MVPSCSPLGHALCLPRKFPLLHEFLVQHEAVWIDYPTVAANLFRPYLGHLEHEEQGYLKPGVFWRVTRALNSSTFILRGGLEL